LDNAYYQQVLEAWWLLCMSSQVCRPHACLSRPAGATYLQGVYLQYNRVQDIFVGTSPFGIVIVKPKLPLRTYDFDGHIAPSPAYLPPSVDNRE
jgi:hypothetical protein